MKMQKITKSFFTLVVMVMFSLNTFGVSNPVFYGTGALAVPNNLITISQSDGSTINVHLNGDAVIHWFTTEDGYTLIKNYKDIFEYAYSDSYGNLIPTGVKAHNVSERIMNDAVILGQIQKNIFYSDVQVKQLQQSAAIAKPNAQKMGGFPTTGTRKLLMILAQFSDAPAVYTQTNFDNYMNQVNYNTTGSFKDYYLENSYNQLTINTTVTVWVTVPNTHNYYGPDAKWAEFVRDAVNAADVAGVDFSQFDNDGDGKVDGVAVIHQGPGQEETSSTNDIWSHNWSLSSGGFTVTKDGKTVDNYTCQPEKSGTGMASIGVMCHEFGHNLGLPDFYDTDYATGGSFDGTGYWDMMASGSYNGTPSGSKPAHHNAYSKVFLSWLTATNISSAASLVAANVEQNKTVYKIATTTTNEYYLVENRQKIGFDAGLPGQGLMIYHVHKDINSYYNSNNINATYPQKMYPVCATATTNPGNTKATYGTINGGGCSFPGTGNKTSFTDATTPWAKSWAGAATNKPITNIVYNSTTKEVSFDFMGGGSVTPVAPTATSIAASSVSTSGATINGTVSAGNATTTVTFEYGLTTSYGSTVNATPNTLSGATATSVSAALTGLTASTTYNYRVKAVNSVNTVYSTNMTFTTSSVPVGYSIPFNESFAGTTIPTNWTQQNVGTGTTNRWALSTTATAGGAANEMKMSYQQVNPATTRLVTPAINTTGYSTLTLSFKHMLDTYGTGATIKVQTSTNGTTWTDVWSSALTATNIAATTVTLNLTSNLNSATTYIAFAVDGNLYQIDYWYIDNVSLTSSTTTTATVTTTAASAITATTATTGGNVTADGGSAVTAKGVCWNTTGTPTIANSFTSNGTGTGSFTSSLTGLTASTTYYVKAYATNANGTTYGSQVSFTTAAAVVVNVPTLAATTAATTITNTTATSGGNITADGGATVTARGVCWATTANPTTANSKTVDGTGTGSFTSSISGLTANTTYYVRAYATNSAGTAYGTAITFTTTNTTTTYCTVAGGSVVYEWIDLVKLNTINNVTKGNAGYGNFTTLSTSIARNSSNILSFSAGFKTTIYTEYWKVWIDYNQNGVFTDAGELVVTGTSRTAATFTGTFVVPATATVGTTRMRVLMSDNSATSSSCGTFTYGEVEDYNINITAAKGNTADLASNQNEGTPLSNEIFDYFTTYPNPTASVLNINLLENQMVNVKIYSLTGAMVLNVDLEYTNPEINVADLKTGTYIIKVNDGQKEHTQKFIKL